jgi:hypothetical protein
VQISKLQENIQYIVLVAATYYFIAFHLPKNTIDTYYQDGQQYSSIILKGYEIPCYSKPNNKRKITLLSTEAESEGLYTIFEGEMIPGGSTCLHTTA